MSITSYFDLQKVEAGESLAINDYAFTTKNLDRIDLMLYRAQQHQHTGLASGIADPVSPPSLSPSSTGGNIPAGVTVRYKYTYVDQYGAETAGSPESTYTTPEPLAVPGPPTVSRTSVGGTLLPGNYFYAISAYVGANTTETPVGDRGYTTVPVGTTTNLITLTLPTLPSGSTGWNIYRRAPGESTYSYLASTTTGPTYVDNGSVAENCNRHPQNTNLTNASNSVTVTLPGATPLVPDGYTWKVYRTYAIGNYSNSLLAWVVEETTEGSGVITPEFVDIGQASQPGSPSTVTEFVQQPGKVDLNDAAEVTGSLPPYRNVIPHVVTFEQVGPLEVGTGTLIWVCEFDEAEIQYVRASLGIGSTPFATPVIVDVNKYDANAATPAWASIYPSATKPRVLVGEQFGITYEPDTYILFRGDALSIDIDQTGGGATPTDADLTVNVFMIVRSTGTLSGTTANETYAWG